MTSKPTSPPVIPPSTDHNPQSTTSKSTSTPAATYPNPNPNPTPQEQAASPPSVSDPTTFTIPSIPTLETAPPTRRLKSHLLLLVLVLGTVLLGWFVGFDLLQVSRPYQHSHSHSSPISPILDENSRPGSSVLGLGSGSVLELGLVLGTVVVGLVAALYWVGIGQVDFWEVLGRYWWWALPGVGVAALAVTIMQERGTELHEVE